MHQRNILLLPVQFFSHPGEVEGWELIHAYSFQNWPKGGEGSRREKCWQAGSSQNPISSFLGIYEVVSDQLHWLYLPVQVAPALLISLTEGRWLLSDPELSLLLPAGVSGVQTSLNS